MLLDVGAGAAPYQHLFKHVQYESADLECVDKQYGQTTYVCDICERIPVEDGRFDYILFNQTLEHLRRPEKALSELARVLRRGGRILCTVPLFYEEHEQPHDYFRYTQFALRSMFSDAGFQVARIEWLEGWFGTCGYMLECIYRHMPDRVPGDMAETEQGVFGTAFLAGFKPIAFAAAAAFYKLDTAGEGDWGRFSEELRGVGGESLNYCAERGIAPDVEVIGIEDINRGAGGGRTGVIPAAPVIDPPTAPTSPLRRLRRHLPPPSAREDKHLPFLSFLAPFARGSGTARSVVVGVAWAANESVARAAGMSSPPERRSAINETCGIVCRLSAERLAVFMVRASPCIGACPQLSQIKLAAKWMAARKLRAVLS